MLCFKQRRSKMTSPEKRAEREKNKLRARAVRSAIVLVMFLNVFSFDMLLFIFGIDSDTT